MNEPSTKNFIKLFSIACVHRELPYAAIQESLSSEALAQGDHSFKHQGFPVQQFSGKYQLTLNQSLKEYIMNKSIISTLFLTVCLFLFSANLMGQALQTEKASLSDEKPVVLVLEEDNDANFSTFSVSPTSYDFLEVCVDPNIPPQFNLSVHNTGGGTESGVVQIPGSAGFTCEGGCSYNLGPNQSQYVTIQFIPPSTGSHSATAYFTYSGGSVQAALSGEGTWEQPPCPRD